MNGIRYHSTDEMKDSGVSWLGNFLPNDWAISRAKYIWKKENRIIHKDDSVLTAFRDGQVTLRENRRTEGYTFAIKEIGYQRVLKGDLVISAMDAFAGAMGISDSTGKCSPVYSICSPNKPVFPPYYGYLLKEMANKNYILSLAKGIRERSTDFRYNEFGETVLTYPPLQDQHRIANFLDIKTTQFDSIISKKEQLIAKLEEAKKALISEVVTGKVNIVDGKLIPRQPEEMKDSGVEWLGMIPKDWDRTTLKHLVITRITDGPHETPEFLDEGVPFLSAEAIVDNKISFTNMRGYISERQFRIYSLKSKVIYGDILICKSGSTTGKSAFVDSYEQFGIWSPLAIIRNHPRRVQNKFLFYVIQSKCFRVQVENYWSFGTQPNIGMGSLENLYVPYSRNWLEQESIAIFLEREIDKIELIMGDTKRQVSILKSAKQSLISEAVTGKIDLRDWEIIEQGGVS